MATFAVSPAVGAVFFLLSFALFICCNGNANGEQQVYIVYMGELPQSNIALKSHHTSILQSAVGSRASKVLLHSYKRSFNGFVATLTEQEKDIVAKMEGVVSVFPNEKLKLHTTRSWDFIGFPQSAKQSTIASDIIVGMLDGGIWPDSPSFNDSGYGPPPSKWKGSCSHNITCNNKIIGAKYYNSDGTIYNPSPIDNDGHGTHTASTAAGNIVSQASLLGLGEGTARGGLPSARLSIYKVCWNLNCWSADILAGFDDAIADGVDIISVSLGFDDAKPYFEDPIAIGAFHAMKNGILTSNSAGNSGPNAKSVANVSPWSLSVAASSIDRKFVAGVKLGNGQTFQGAAINTYQLNDTEYPLLWGGNIPSDTTSYTRDLARYCHEDALNTTLAQGAILLCDAAIEAGDDQFSVGAMGTIMQRDIQSFAFEYILPATTLNQNDSAQVLNYINNASNPTATIRKSIAIKDKSAPSVADFSSRGPNPISVDILKPDIAAPGVEILAAWSRSTTVTGEMKDDRVVSYNIISGTSMACPHGTGAAAYVKSFHPYWSPAAIKSALMTTATVMSPTNNPDAEFAYGAGQINPIKAVNPGLIYDIGESDYVNFLCGQGYDTTTLRQLTGDNNYACSKNNSAGVWDLNYPAFSLNVENSGPTTRVFHRIVTNVGSPISIYKALVKTPDSSRLNIQVQPPVLFFTRVGQKLTYKVTVTAKSLQNIVSGSLDWDDGFHRVRSPVVAHIYT